MQPHNLTETELLTEVESRYPADPFISALVKMAGCAVTEDESELVDILREHNIDDADELRQLIMAAVQSAWTISDFLELPEVWDYLDDCRNPQHLATNNKHDRAERIWDAAEHGADGSTHSEIIQDQRDAVAFAERSDLIAEATADRLERELDQIEQWHEQNGSLWDEVG